MEIRGGNRAIDTSMEAPGLDVYVHSVPYLASQTGGGDIYYLTSCASGRITRMLLADVSGHGEMAANLAISLRDLLRANVNTISQERFVEQMNREFGKLADESGFATAVVATFFEPRRSLSISIAGHPAPIYYTASKKCWQPLDSANLDPDAAGNLPLGILDRSEYPGRTIQSSHGDMFLLYSDAFIESVNQDQQMLGIDGVVELLNQMQNPEPGEVIPYLHQQIGSLASGNLADDDATLLLGHLTPTRVRVRDNFLALFRLLGKTRDRTQLQQAALSASSPSRG